MSIPTFSEKNVLFFENGLFLDLINIVVFSTFTALTWRIFCKLHFLLMNIHMQNLRFIEVFYVFFIFAHKHSISAIFYHFLESM